MANAPSKPQAPAAPKAQQAPAAPKAEGAAEEKSEKKGRVQYQEVFDTAEAATKEASTRTKGPRRAFECKYEDETFYVVANNEGRAGGVAFKQLGGEITELGAKGRRAPATQASVGSIMEAINAMPEADKAAVLAQLAALTGGKK